MKLPHTAELMANHAYRTVKLGRDTFNSLEYTDFDDFGDDFDTLIFDSFDILAGAMYAGEYELVLHNLSDLRMKRGSEAVANVVEALTVFLGFRNLNHGDAHLEDYMIVLKTAVIADPTRTITADDFDDLVPGSFGGTRTESVIYHTKCRFNYLTGMSPAEPFADINGD